MDIFISVRTSIDICPQFAVIMLNQLIILLSYVVYSLCSVIINANRNYMRNITL